MITTKEDVQALLDVLDGLEVKLNILRALPPSRQLSLAITKFEEGQMWVSKVPCCIPPEGEGEEE